MHDSYIQVLTTVSSADEAQVIGDLLLEKRLAGCVQMIGPLRSLYRWQGRIEDAEEWLCLIKSRAGLYHQIEEAIRRVHSYDVPEILALPILNGYRLYLEWLDDQLEESDD
jgi:periplasmic divalent cation tolerance protein